MIQELDIQNLAIIDHLRINFFKGMTVLTGETGAGKSIIIDALNLLTGSRGSRHFIRSGQKELVLQGLFTFSRKNPVYGILDRYGIDHSDGSLIIQRRIYRSGRNVCRVNGILVNTDVLKKLGCPIIDIQGQDAHQTLLNPATHLGLLDAFAEKRVQPLLTRYHHYYHCYRALKHLITERYHHRQEWARRLDVLKFQIKDIHDAHLQPNEDVSLARRRLRLLNYRNIKAALSKSYSVLNGTGSYSPVDMIGTAMTSMQDIAGYGKDFKRIEAKLQNIYYDLQDLTTTLADRVEDQDFDTNELNQVESRLSTIDRLKRKYGSSIQSILQYYKKSRRRLIRLNYGQKNGQRLAHHLKLVRDRLSSYGSKLSLVRHEVAKHLEKLVHQQLTDLYMKPVLFRVRFTKTQRFYLNGNERVEFYVRTNPGEGFAPLARSASGGELSRIMLALRIVFNRVQDFGTVVFDEIDTGVGGRVAQAIATKMVQISRKTQVICISHLPQVAAMSDYHYLVQKTVTRQQTTTHLTSLNQRGKIRELARMLAGTTVTRSALVHAKELMKLARQAREPLKNS